MPNMGPWSTLLKSNYFDGIQFAKIVKALVPITLESAHPIYATNATALVGCIHEDVEET